MSFEIPKDYGATVRFKRIKSINGSDAAEITIYVPEEFPGDMYEILNANIVSVKRRGSSGFAGKLPNTFYFDLEKQ